ncbi:hypothetical protein Nmel_013127 [Mimus melanotis]
MDVPAPGFIQVPVGIQEDVESTSQVSSQPGSLGMWVIRALSNVGSVVEDEIGAVHEALPTLGALAGPPLVFGQGRALGEALPTLGTLVGPLPRVDVAVGDEVRTVLEQLDSLDPLQPKAQE